MENSGSGSPDGPRHEEDYVQNDIHQRPSSTSSMLLPTKTSQVPKIHKSVVSPSYSRSSRVDARTVLWYLTFCGFAINYMIRININITIVDMVVVAKPTMQLDERTIQIGSSSSSAAAAKNDTSSNKWMMMGEASGPAVDDSQIQPIMDAIKIPFSLERWILDRMGVG